MSADGSVLPPRQLRFMHESDDAFLPIADHLCRNVLAHLDGSGLDFDLLDVGCGYGRLAYGLRRAGFRGRYRGFDILREQIDWLGGNFSSHLAAGEAERYRFDHFNVHNARYNPGGLPFDDVALPYAEASVDCVTALSLFTHMDEDDVRQYLRRIGPLLREGGIWIATFFSVPDGFTLAAQHPAMRYRLTEQVSEHAYIHNPAQPLHVIAYQQAFLRRLFADAGLAVVAHQPGSWLGDINDGEFQDWFVLRRQAAPAIAEPAAAVASVAAAPDASASSIAAAPVCNICGGTDFGPGPAGRKAATGAAPCCRHCGALERQRVVRHLFQALPIGFLDWRRSLQFSPDQAQNPSWFRSHEISIYNGPDSIDIQAIDRPDDSYDFITLSHVLECIPRDLAAFDELQRVLSPRGLLHISFAAAQTRPVSVDFETAIDRHNNLHLYGRDVYRRFGCAAKGMGMLVVEGLDPVTGVREAAHLFANHAPDIALLRGWLLGWDATLTIVDEALP